MLLSLDVFRCLSRVYVAAEAKRGLIFYTIDSDSMLTKGLAAVLAEGLSGNSAEAIQAVKPYFVKMAGLSTSLTPGSVKVPAQFRTYHRP